MKKFDWNRYYFDLETGDPKKFPFWQFMYHEMVSIVSFAIVGIVMSFFIILIIGITIQVLINNYPDFTFSMFRHYVCDTP